jgi:hypothetical protein
VNFIEDHEAVLVAGEECGRVGEFGAVFAGFEVEVYGGGVGGDAWASVVLPTWRGPVKATAAWRARADWTAVRARRGIILAYYPWRG